MTPDGTPLDAVYRALDDSARASIVALRASLRDLDSAEHGPVAVRAILSHASVASTAVARLAQLAAARRPEEAAAASSRFDLAAAQRLIDYVAGLLSRCPNCGGLRPSSERPVDGR